MTDLSADDLGIDPDEFPRWTSSVPIHFVKGEWMGVSTIVLATNMTDAQVRTYLSRGKLPGYKFPNGRVLVRRDDLMDFLLGFEDPTPVARTKGADKAQAEDA